MTLYQFKTEDGEVFERFFPMGQCPREIEVDGKKAKRVFGTPALHVKTGDAGASDREKLREEVQHEARESGIQQLVPLKRQPLEKQLKDLKANRSKFKEEMGAANEESRKKAREKCKLPPSSMRQYEQHVERRQRQAYESRKIKMTGGEP